MNAKRLFDQGIDPYAVWIRRCREKGGVRTWMSMRMNDVHFVNITNYFRNTTFQKRTENVDVSFRGFISRTDAGVSSCGGRAWRTRLLENLPYAAAISLPVLGTVVVRLLRIPYETCFVTDERMGFFFFVALVEAALTISAAALAGHFSIETVASYATLRLVASVAAGAMVVCRCLRRHPFSFVRPQFRLGDVKDLMRFFG